MILFYILIAVMPFANPPIVWRLFGGTATFKVLGGLCSVYAVMDIARRGSIPAFFRTWQARLFATLFFLAAVSFVSKSYGHSAKNTTLLMYTDFLIFFFVIISLVRSVERLRSLLIAAVVGISYGSADIIREWLSMHGSNPWFRAGDIVGDGNDFSTCAALILPFIFLMIFNAKKLSRKLLFCGCLLLAFTAIVLTGSRGGALAAASSILYVIWHSRRRVRNIALVGVLSLPLLLIVPVSPLYRFLHPVNEWNGINTEQTRLDAWYAGLRMFETYPIFGVGVGNFKILMPKYVAAGVDVDTIAHNTYIEYLAEMGPLGAFLFIGIAYFSLRSLRRVRRRTHSTDPPSTLYLTALSLEAGFVGYLIGALFLSTEYDKMLWVVIFLSACLPGLVPSRRRAEAPALDIRTSVAPVESGLREGS